MGVASTAYHDILDARVHTHVVHALSMCADTPALASICLACAAMNLSITTHVCHGLPITTNVCHGVQDVT